MLTPQQVDRLERLFGTDANKYEELLRASEQHRSQHTECWLRPPHPLLLPLFRFLHQFVVGTTFLQIGCGLGYKTVLLLEAGGPQLHIDVVEPDRQHLEAARLNLKRYGLLDSVKWIDGEPPAVVAELPGPYDVVVVGGLWRDYPRYLPYFKRLIASGGFVVSTDLHPLFEDAPESAAAQAPLQKYLESLISDPAFKTVVLPNYWVALSVRVTL